MDKGLFIRFFGGIPMHTWDEIPLIPLGQWFLPIAVWLLLQGAYLEKHRRNEALVCYRYRTLCRWWSHRFLSGLARGIFTGTFLLSLAVAANFICRIDFTETVWRAGVLWLLHILTMQSMLLLADLFQIRRFIPAALLLLEGVTFLIGFKQREMAPFMYGMWGMYLQSAWYDRVQGFCVLAVAVIETGFIGLGYYSGKVLLEKRKRYENTGKEVL